MNISDIIVEKGVPLPQLNHKGKYARKNGWSEFLKRLENEDSFVIPTSMVNNCRQASYFAGVRLTAAPESDGSYRIWRVE